MPTLPNVASKILPAIFMVENLGPDDRTEIVAANIIGTAFVLDEAAGWLVTAKHVVNGLDVRTLRARSVFSKGTPTLFALGTHRTVLEIVEHPDRDIALLRMAPQATDGRGVPFSTRVPLVAEGVLLIGFAAGTDYTYCDELLGARSPKSPTPLVVDGILATLVPHDGRAVEMYVSDVTTHGGNSGGALVGGDDGNVLGLHVAGGGGYGYALPIDYSLDFLARVKASAPTSPISPRE